MSKICYDTEATLSTIYKHRSHSPCWSEGARRPVVVRVEHAQVSLITGQETTPPEGWDASPLKAAQPLFSCSVLYSQRSWGGPEHPEIRFVHNYRWINPSLIMPPELLLHLLSVDSAWGAASIILFFGNFLLNLLWVLLVSLNLIFIKSILSVSDCQ